MEEIEKLKEKAIDSILAYYYLKKLLEIASEDEKKEIQDAIKYHENIVRRDVLFYLAEDC